MSVQEKINNDEYKSTLPRAERPKEPLVLRKSAKELTKNDAIILPIVTESYETKMRAFHEIGAARKEDTQRLQKLFRHDLEEEFGTTGHPKADLLYTKAIESGLSNGLDCVLWHYDDLSELLDLEPKPSMRP